MAPCCVSGEHEGPIVRSLAPSEVGIAFDWAEAEGWDPGVADEGPFCECGDNFIGAFVHGAIVGCISLTTYGSSYAFIGFFIVTPAHRRKGVGAALWSEAMARAANRVVGLDGVIAQVGRYERADFKEAFRHVRMAGELPAPDAAAKLLLSRWGTLVSVLAWESGLLDALLAFEAAAGLFPVERPTFVRAWLSTHEHTARVAFEKGVICGYGVIRPTRSGAYKIAPLFARDMHVASALLAALLGSVPSHSRVLLDVPDTNEDAMMLARTIGLNPVFECARMYAGGQPPAGEVGARVFAVTSLELG